MIIGKEEWKLHMAKFLHMGSGVRAWMNYIQDRFRNFQLSMTFVSF